MVQKLGGAGGGGRPSPGSATVYDQNAFLGLQKGAWFNFFLTFFFPFKVAFLATKSLQCEQLGTAHLIFVMGGRGGWVCNCQKKNLQKKFKRKKNRAQESKCKKISKQALRAHWICICEVFQDKRKHRSSQSGEFYLDINNFILFVGFTSETDTSRQTFPNLLII